MLNNSLTSISPLDGRYQKQIEILRNIFSEYGLIKYRVLVELSWLKALANNESITEIPKFSNDTIKCIYDIISNFNLDNAREIKDIEKTTNHDVKAVEYWIKQRFNHIEEIKNNNEFIHFACTSEDINNLCHALMIKDALNQAIFPKLDLIIEKLIFFAKNNKNIAMISRTHGQPATPTTLGKEFANYSYRLLRQLKILKQQEILGKINGAVGNYNAHYLTYPNINWKEFCREFVESLGLNFNPYTTQIEPHDYLAEVFHNFIRINTILSDLNKDIWAYISIGYFKQKIKEGEVGSSTMPHKVNPIDFENSEGNLGLANAMLSYLSEKLPISRWQRDLTDSTVLRNMGVGIGYFLLAFNSLLKGLDKLEVNYQVIQDDLNNNWELLAEPIQMIMRKFKIANPYEELKKLTRGKDNISKEIIQNFIKDLNIPREAKQTLLSLTPSKYIGIANILADYVDK